MKTHVPINPVDLIRGVLSLHAPAVPFEDTCKCGLQHGSPEELREHIAERIAEVVLT